MLATVHDSLITAGEMQIHMRPKTVPAVPLYPIIYTHGAGARADAMDEYGGAARRSRLVHDAGITGISGDFGGRQTWGNDTAMAAMTAAYNWLQGKPGVKNGKVILCGGSMGGLNALVWAAANPTKVACVSIYIPVLNPSEIHDLNLTHQGVGYAQFVDQSYPPNGWNTALLRATKDPLFMAGMGKYTGIPIRLHFGLNDGLCRPESAWEFGRRVPTAELFPILGGHEESTELQIDREDEVDFMLRYAK